MQSSRKYEYATFEVLKNGIGIQSLDKNNYLLTGNDREIATRGRPTYRQCGYPRLQATRLLCTRGMPS